MAGLASLRFHPSCFYRPEGSAENLSFPALIAAITDLSGAITGVHRTWLDPAGGKAPVDTPRRAMGNLLGHAVRFGAVDDELAAVQRHTVSPLHRCTGPSTQLVQWQARLSANVQ